MSGKQRNIRKRRALDEQEELPDGPDAAEGEDGAPRLTAEDIRLLQKQRQRHGGVEASTLAVADTRAERKAAAAVAAGSRQQDVLQAAFKRERRLHSEEEDPHMKQYIEEQLAKRMGKDVEAERERQREEEEQRRRMADPLLAALPEGLQKRQQDTELGPSWVAGMTEVPLSLEQKLKNIEETEAAKKRMLAIVPDDDDDFGGGGGGPLRRGAYPVSFGKQNPKHLKVIAEAQATKARQRERQEEKKRKKKEEFAGW